MLHKGYKGFDSQLQCHGFQYEIGEEYERGEIVVPSVGGIPFYENPLDLFESYPPGRSRYCSVESIGVEYKFSHNSMVSASRLLIGEEVGLVGLVEESVKSTLDSILSCHKKSIASGSQSVVFSTKEYTAVTHSGRLSAAANAGYKSVAINTGDRSTAVNMGYWSIASNAGRQSVAADTGDQSATINTGDDSTVVNTGFRSAAVNTGGHSVASNTGDLSASVATGVRSVAVNIGKQSVAEVSGRQSAAIAIGYQSRAKGSKGCWLVLGEVNGHGVLIDVQCRKVDGVRIKEDTFYVLENGEFKEAE